MSNESGTGVYVYQQIVKTTAEWESDKTVPVENVWLFERRDDGKIVTKLSDGKHCYADLPAYGLSAWQAAQMGGYEGTEEEFYESLGTFGDKVEMIESLVSSLSGKYAETPTLEATPTEDTLTYTPEDSEEPRAFAIGQQCRVYEEEEEDYVFYQLYDIKDGKADWRVAGSGGTSANQEKAVITLTSNQGAPDTALVGKKVTVQYSDQNQVLTWQGTALEVKIPVNMSYEVSVEVASGYTTPAKQSFVAVGGNERQIVFSYSCEKVTVSVTTDDSADCSGRTVTVKKTSGGEVLGTGKGAQVIVKVPTGTGYTVSVDDFTGYTKPADQSFTANQASRSVSMAYKKIRSNTIHIDQTIADPETMITGDVNGEVIRWIKENSHRVLAKKTAEGETTYCRLKDEGGAKYHDGTAAQLNGNEGDVFMKPPRFFYKGTEGDQVDISFAKEKIDDSYVEWDGNTLIGVYEGYITGNKAYSRSGVDSTGSVSQANWKQFAHARGKGYQLVDWQMHCVLGCLYYAMYGNTNCQKEIGLGTNDYRKQTGQTDSLGMTDTKGSGGNGDSQSINFWGLENWWGNKLEWVDDYDNPANSRTATVNDPANSGTRVLDIPDYTGYYPKKMKFGKFLDLVATDDDPKNGSDNTGYCDYQWWPNGTSSSPRALLRSVCSSRSYGGVAYAYAGSASSVAGSGSGSRLAFKGVCREAESVEAFKLLPVL
jgi:hypothetical protein